MPGRHLRGRGEMRSPGTPARWWGSSGARSRAPAASRCDGLRPPLTVPRPPGRGPGLASRTARACAGGVVSAQRPFRVADFGVRRVRRDRAGCARVRGRRAGACGTAVRSCFRPGPRGCSTWELWLCLPARTGCPQVSASPCQSRPAGAVAPERGPHHLAVPPSAGTRLPLPSVVAAPFDD